MQKESFKKRQFQKGVFRKLYKCQSTVETHMQRRSAQQRNQHRRKKSCSPELLPNHQCDRHRRTILFSSCCLLRTFVGSKLIPVQNREEYIHINAPFLNVPQARKGSGVVATTFPKNGNWETIAKRDSESRFFWSLKKEKENVQPAGLHSHPASPK